MKWIVRILKLAIVALNTAQSALENFDQNAEGWDDAAAEALGTARDTLQAIINSNPVEIEARGYDEIEAFGTKVISDLTALKTSTIPKPEKVEQAKALQQLLFDPAKVYQAQRDSDAELLKGFKSQAANLVAEIEALPEE